MANKTFKDMQSKIPNNVICASCGCVILPGYKVEGYRERDIDAARARHNCDELKEFKDKMKYEPEEGVSQK